VLSPPLANAAATSQESPSKFFITSMTRSSISLSHLRRYKSRITKQIFYHQANFLSPQAFSTFDFMMELKIHVP
jgi:hypothetical protein